MKLLFTTQIANFKYYCLCLEISSKCCFIEQNPKAFKILQNPGPIYLALVTLPSI